MAHRNSVFLYMLPLYFFGFFHPLRADNLSDLRILAEENSIALKAAKEQIDLAKMRTRSALREFFPQIKFQWRESKGETITDPYRSLNYGTRVIFPLFKGMSTKYNYVSEKMGLRTAIINFAKVKDKLYSDLSESYWNVVRYKMIYNIWKNLIDNIKEGKI